MAYQVAAPERVSLQEYGEPVVCRAGKIDLRALADANARWSRLLGLPTEPIRVELLDDGSARLRAEGVTGIIRVGHTDIEIAPKFLDAAEGSWQTVLWRILAIVEGGHVDDVLTAAHEFTSFSLPDLLAEMFMASYAKGAARGLPRGYLSERSSGTLLRGCFDTSRATEWVARPWEVPCISDLLTDDTPLARLMRWTAECLAATVGSPGRARAMREVSAGLSHVTGGPPHLLDAQRIVLGAQHRGLETAKLVGLLLLDGAGVHHASGACELSGFLWNSDVVYENYVYWLCSRAASRRGERVSKQSIKFGEVVAGRGSRLETIPDVVFWDGRGSALAISDSKYKRLGTRPRAHDTYQVLTAGHVLGCRRISLTYPVSDQREPTVWKVRSALGSGDVELMALPLNLMLLVSPNGHEALVDVIDAWLGKVAGEVTEEQRV